MKALFSLNLGKTPPRRDRSERKGVPIAVWRGNPRILYVSEAHPGPYPYVFAGILGAIEALGFAVSRLDPATATFELYREQVSRFRPDVIFCFIRQTWAACKMAEFLNQHHPAVILNWFQEDPNGVTAELLEASRSFDHWFTINARMVSHWPTKAHFMPPAFDERIYDDFGLSRQYDVSFVGQLGHGLSTQMYMPYMQELARYGKRAILCLERPIGVPLLPEPLERALRSRQVRSLLQRLPVWRHTWVNPRDEREKALVINRSKIHFGISRVRGFWEDDLKRLIPSYPFDEHGLFYQVKPRVFHALGAGAMVLNDYCFELEQLFEVGKEIVTFKFGDLGELREKLMWYTFHDAERERIARAGYERGRKQHTFTARIRQILDVVEREA